MVLSSGHSRGAGGPVKTGNGSWGGCVILKAVLLRSHHVAALVLSDLDLPLPGGGGVPGVDIDLHLIALTGGRDIHVLASVVATDGWGNIASGVGHSQAVCVTVTHCDGISVDDTSSCEARRRREDHGIKVNPELADIGVCPAEFVGTGVLVGADGEGVHDGVGVVGVGTAATGYGEDTADSE